MHYLSDAEKKELPCLDFHKHGSCKHGGDCPWSHKKKLFEKWLETPANKQRFENWGSGKG